MKVKVIEGDRSHLFFGKADSPTSPSSSFFAGPGPTPLAAGVDAMAFPPLLMKYPYRIIPRIARDIPLSCRALMASLKMAQPPNNTRMVLACPRTWKLVAENLPKHKNCA